MVIRDADESSQGPRTSAKSQLVLRELENRFQIKWKEASETIQGNNKEKKKELLFITTIMTVSL